MLAHGATDLPEGVDAIRPREASPQIWRVVEVVEVMTVSKNLELDGGNGAVRVRKVMVLLT